MKMENLYTLDEITLLGHQLSDLKGKTLLNNYNDFNVLINFEIKSTSQLDWSGFFKPKKAVQMFYIDSITLSGSSKNYYHSNDSICTMYGVNTLKDYSDNYIAMEAKLDKFALKHKINIRFGDIKYDYNNVQNFNLK